MAIIGMFKLPFLFSTMLSSLVDLSFFRFLSVLFISVSNGSIQLHASYACNRYLKILNTEIKVRLLDNFDLNFD